MASEAKKRLRLPTGRDVDWSSPKACRTARRSACEGWGRARLIPDPGDALLTIRLAPHERFTPEGLDLRLKLPIGIEEAVLGGRVRIPTLTGAVSMTIPPMTIGRTFRLRGKGLPGKTGMAISSPRLRSASGGNRRDADGICPHT